MVCCPCGPTFASRSAANGCAFQGSQTKALALQFSERVSGKSSPFLPFGSMAMLTTCGVGSKPRRKPLLLLSPEVDVHEATESRRMTCSLGSTMNGIAIDPTIRVCE